MYEDDSLVDVVRDFGLQHHLTDGQIEALTLHLEAEYAKAMA